LTKALNILYLCSNLQLLQTFHVMVTEQNSKADFLGLTKRYYGVTTRTLDYSDAEHARTTINDWVAAQTADKIQELIPTGTLSGLTRLLLVNAIYFKGQWASPFDPALTRPAPFWLTPDHSVQVPFMNKEQQFLYAENATAQILGLPYGGDDLVMLILLPRATHGLAQLEAALTLETLGPWVQELTPTKVLVALPRFQLTASCRLNEQLQALGMVDAFSDDADFSGMDGTRYLYIGAVLHQAFIVANEEGTEAAAATAVEMKVRSVQLPPPVFRADHPFVFMILEQHTGSVLFLGRVVDPA
jgi:serine protease inhibitor